MKPIPFKCQYQNFSCDKLNTATNTRSVECDECSHSKNNGNRSTSNKSAYDLNEVGGLKKAK